MPEDNQDPTIHSNEATPNESVVARFIGPERSGEEPQTLLPPKTPISSDTNEDGLSSRVGAGLAPALDDQHTPLISPNINRDEQAMPSIPPDTNEDAQPYRVGAELAPTLDNAILPDTDTNDQSPQSLPPEAQGELNGGPLGCCLGVFIGLIVSLLIAVFGRLYANPLVPVFHSALLVLILLRILMAIGAIAGAIIFGYFGWKIGRKLYREYEPPVIPIREYKRPKRKVARNKVKHSTRG
jgi:hypothetical protein